MRTFLFAISGLAALAAPAAAANRNFAVTLSYDRQQQNGRGLFNNDYRGNRISLSILAQR